jgi:hypothetical protein
MRKLPQIQALLRQRPGDTTPYEETVQTLKAIAGGAGSRE